MPISIIDSSIEQAGNPADALKAASESTTATQSTTTQQTQIPDRFKGKSTEEVYQAYANLEKHAGRLANDLGQQRQMTDQLLQQKRENDLRANGATQVQRQQTQAAAVTASDLLENPTQALDRYFETKESAVVQGLQARLAQQESLMAQNSFVSRHPDWQEHTNDPAFVEWARQTPWRANLAASAARNDLQAADALLTEYKAYQPLLKQTAQGANLDAARKVGFERTASSGDATSTTQGPIIRRRDNMALRISDPDKYESPAYQNALLAAIRDGRYKD